MKIETKFNIGERVNFMCYRAREPMLTDGNIRRIIIHGKNSIRYSVNYLLNGEHLIADFWEWDLEKWNTGEEKTICP